MTKIYIADSTPAELQGLTEIVKSTANFLNSNPEAKTLLEPKLTLTLHKLWR